MSDQSQKSRRIDVDVSRLMGVKGTRAAVGVKPTVRRAVTVGVKPV